MPSISRQRGRPSISISPSIARQNSANLRESKF
jgi:hypothetical protein